MGSPWRDRERTRSDSCACRTFGGAPNPGSSRTPHRGALVSLVSWRVMVGDVREQLATLPDGSAQCCVTSPPYWGLRDYGVVGQLGLESTPDAYVAAMVAVFTEVRRVLADDGVLWLNLGDSY